MDKKKTLFIVKMNDEYLYPRDGNVCWTDKKDLAGHFFSEDEAVDTADANGLDRAEYTIIPISVPADTIPNRN